MLTDDERDALADVLGDDFPWLGDTIDAVERIVAARVSAALREAADECDVLQMREKIAPGGIGDGDFKHGKKRAFGEARIMLRQRAIDYWRTGLGTDTRRPT